MTGPSKEDRRGDALRSADMIETAVLLETLSAKGEAAFHADPFLQAAAVRYLEIIGDAGGKVSLSTRKRYPEVPWSRMRGFANLAKHECWRVNVVRVWSSVRSIPPIRRSLSAVRVDATGVDLLRE